jgi:hypothetical protein
MPARNSPVPHGAKCSLDREPMQAANEHIAAISMIGRGALDGAIIGLYLRVVEGEFPSCPPVN